MSPRLTLRLAGASALALAVVTCSDAVTGPRRFPAARIALSPSLSSDARQIMGRLQSFALDVNTVHLVLVRPPSEVLKDTTIAFPAGVDTLAIELDVDLEAAEETLQAQVELRDNDILLFSGTQSILAKRGQTSGGGEGGGAPITLIYAGPGKGASTLSIVQRTPAIATGGTVQLSTAVLDANGQPVTGLPLSWTSGDATRLTIDANGIARSIGKPGTVWAKVEGLNGSMDSVSVAISQQATRLTVVSGNGQTVTAGTALGAPMVVRVADALDQPMPAAKVGWRVKGGGGTIGADTTTSDASGNAQTTYTSGSVSGIAPTIVASIGVDSVTFTQGSVTPAAAAQLALLAQPISAQQAKVIAPAPQVQLQDQYGNAKPQAGVPVTVALGTGATGRTLAGTLTVNTDASGTATFSDLAISGPTGSVTLAFSAASLTGVQTAAIAFANTNPSTVTIVGGDAQKDTVGKQLAQPLQVKVTDSQSAAVPNATIDWEITSGAASLASTPSTTTASTSTGADGIASTPLWLGNAAGEVVVTATVRGFSLVATFKDTAVAGTPAGLIFTQAPSLASQAGALLAQQPALQLVDAFGNKTSAVGLTVTAGIIRESTCTIDNQRFGPALTLQQSAMPAPTPSLAPARAPSLPRVVRTPRPLRGRNGKLVPWPTRPRPITPPGARAAKARTPHVPAPFRAPAHPPRYVRGPRPAQRLTPTRAQIQALRTVAPSSTNPRSPRLSLSRTMSATTLRSPAPANATNSVSCGTLSLAGTLTVPVDASGAATYTDLRVDATVGYYALVFLASDSTLAPATSDWIALSAGAPAFLVGGYYSTWSARSDSLDLTQGDTITGYAYVIDSVANYVPGVALTWQSTAGAGDGKGAVTDTVGFAQRSWVVGTVTVSDTLQFLVRAAGLADSLSAVGITSLPYASYVDPEQGTGQVGAPGATLQPFSARVLNQHYHPFGGGTVSWTIQTDISNPGTLSTTQSTADANGVAQTTLTLPSDTAGMTIVVSANAAESPADFFAVIAKPGYAKTWVSSDTSDYLAAEDWSNPNNWSPVGVPTISDKVFVPYIDESYNYLTGSYREYPVLRTSTDVAALTVGDQYYYATMAIDSATLTVHGDIAAGGELGITAIDDSTSMVVSAGTGAQLSGYLGVPLFRMTAPAVIPLQGGEGASFAVDGNAEIDDLLDLGESYLYVSGSLAVRGNGLLRMRSNNADAYVAGSATFAGASTTGEMIAGTIEVGGTLRQKSTVSPTSLVTGDSLWLSLNPSGADTIAFDSPAQSTVHKLSIYGVGPLHYASALQVDTLVTYDTSAVTGVAPITTQSFSQYAAGNWSGVPEVVVTGTEFPFVAGTGPALLRLKSDSMTMNSSGTTYTGNVLVDDGRLDLNEPMTIQGDLSVVGANAVLNIQNEVVQLQVTGNVLFDGADSRTHIGYGSLTVGGDFTQQATYSPSSFAPFAFVTTFNGTGKQTVTFASTDTLNGSWFSSVDITNASGSPVVFAGGTVAARNGVTLSSGTASSAPWLQIPAASTLLSQGNGYVSLGSYSHVTVDGGWDVAYCTKLDNTVTVDGSNAAAAQCFTPSPPIGAGPTATRTAPRSPRTVATPTIAPKQD